MNEILPAKQKLVIRRYLPPKGRWARLKWHLFPNSNPAYPTRLVLRGEQVSWLMQSMQRHDIAITPKNITLVCQVRFIGLVVFAKGRQRSDAMFLKDQLEMSCLCERSRAQAQELAEMTGTEL